MVKALKPIFQILRPNMPKIHKVSNFITWDVHKALNPRSWSIKTHISQTWNNHNPWDLIFLTQDLSKGLKGQIISINSKHASRWGLLGQEWCQSFITRRSTQYKCQARSFIPQIGSKGWYLSRSISSSHSTPSLTTSSFFFYPPFCQNKLSKAKHTQQWRWNDYLGFLRLRESLWRLGYAPTCSLYSGWP